jgi:hypothetical protein
MLYKRRSFQVPANGKQKPNNEQCRTKGHGPVMASHCYACGKSVAEIEAEKNASPEAGDIILLAGPLP